MLNLPDLDPEWLEHASYEELAEYAAALEEVALPSPYCPHVPTAKQELLLNSDKDEVLYGGAAGGGKSDGLLMLALQTAQHEGSNTLVLRRTMRQLSLPEGLLTRSHEWLGNTDAHWSGQDNQWTFPNQSTITFGFMDGPRDKYRYQGAAFQLVMYDELTQFREPDYTYLFSRARRTMKLKETGVKIRFRSASNPGDIGHDWVKARFITDQDPTREFIPAMVQDNPHLDINEYLAMLDKMDPITRMQLASGNWDVRIGAGMFKREDFIRVPQKDWPNPRDLQLCRAWDTAATEGAGDWTVGVLMGKDRDNYYYVLDVQRAQLAPAGVDALMKATRDLDGKRVAVRKEREAGSSGPTIVWKLGKEMYDGYDFSGVGNANKVTRAKPFAAAVGQHRVFVPEGAPWYDKFVGECELFPTKEVHDDQVDAASIAYEYLSGGVLPAKMSLPDLSRTNDLLGW